MQLRKGFKLRIKGTIFHQTYTVDEKVYNGFLTTFCDKNPLHTDITFAQVKGFKSMVMHGNILNGFLSHFIGECLPTEDVIIHSQEIKFYHPVYLNDILQLVIEVDDYFESVNTVDFKFYFQNEDKKKVAKGKLTIGLL
jgi:3-hydroxybutyryl-CoA dehydratase